MNISSEQKLKFYNRRQRYRNHEHGKIMFSKEMLNLTPEPEQEQALMLSNTKKRLAIKAGHGVGKTVFIVIDMLHHLFCYTDSIVVCTAPSKHQLRDQLWRETAIWLSKSVKPMQSFFDWKPEKIIAAGRNDRWYATQVSSTDPHRLAGKHHKYLKYLVDEAPGVKESAFEVIEGALTQPENSIVLIGNPTKNSGYFYQNFTKPMGIWGTATFSSLNSRLAGPEYAKRMADRYGENSNIYRVRVLGEFPKSEDDAILDIDLIYSAVNRDEVTITNDEIEGGCDVARFGSDRTIIYIRKGLEIIDFAEIDYSDLTAVQNRVIELIKKHNVRKFKIDETGLGSGVVDNLKSMVQDNPYYDCSIIGVANNQKAQDTETYENAGTEMYFDLREILKYAKIPNDEELIGELSIRKYGIHRTTGRIVIESKESVRDHQKRQGLLQKSPDKSDALALCFYRIEENPSDYISISKQNFY